MAKTIKAGFRIMSGTLADAIQQVNRFREEIRPLVEAAYTKDMAARMATALDTDRVPKGISARQYALRQMDEDLRRLKQGETTLGKADWTCFVYLIAHADGLFGTVITEHEEWSDMWMAEHNVEELRYWDHPLDREGKGIPDEEWERRRAIWTTVMAPSWSIEMIGIPIQCGVNAGERPEGKDAKRDFVAAMPSIAERAETLAKAQIAHERTLIWTEDDNLDIEAMLKISNSPETKARHQTLVAELKDRLQDITADDIKRVHATFGAHSFPRPATPGTMSGQ